jgi:hypothetical protein
MWARVFAERLLPTNEPEETSGEIGLRTTATARPAAPLYQTEFIPFGDGF